MQVKRESECIGLTTSENPHRLKKSEVFFVHAGKFEEALLSLHVPCALGLCCSSTEVLPAEGSKQHGSRQIHGGQIVGSSGIAGLGLLSYYSKDVQGLVP